jgi:hypothetical protein
MVLLMMIREVDMVLDSLLSTFNIIHSHCSYSVAVLSRESKTISTSLIIINKTIHRGASYKLTISIDVVACCIFIGTPISEYFI